ncbi:MAG: hypothetical protein M1838_005077, partial [Thelocarpon superellum]
MPGTYPTYPTVRRGSLTRVSSLSNSASADRESSPASSVEEPAVKYQIPRPRHLARQSYRAPNVRRWDGPRRITADWDALRRDPELWTPDGDCFVHLHGRGQSRRGPSFRLPFAAIKAARCLPLLERYSIQTLPASPYSTASSTSSFDSGYFGCPTSSHSTELYVPAPPHYSTEQAFLYHLATRNFFAWILNKPLVGAHLGSAAADLLDRMNRFRCADENNAEAILAYLDQQAYTDFRECPDMALAMLYFAERHKLKELWIDAFAHCTGMNERLSLSAELPAVSRVTKQLITRARLEMDIRIERCSHQLNTFLDDELSDTYLGLGNGARAHLERFRSFLHSYYVGKFGFWPPVHQEGTQAYPRAIYTAMYQDFRNVYEYLVDSESTPSLADNLRPATGGLCVLQNIAAFDQRHHYLSLPHPMPLLPLATAMARQRSLGTMSLGRSLRKAAKADKRSMTLAGLWAATNSDNLTILTSPMVRAYMTFERQSTMKAEEKVSAADARKVRFLAIYAVLQTLISVTRAPSEVVYTEGVSYNLCCLTHGTPPWEGPTGCSRSGSSSGGSHGGIQRESSGSSGSSGISSGGTFDIRPDTDYNFAYKTSLTPNLSVRHPQPRRASFHEILVHG